MILNPRSLHFFQVSREMAPKNLDDGRNLADDAKNAPILTSELVGT